MTCNALFVNNCSKLEMLLILSCKGPFVCPFTFVHIQTLRSSRVATVTTLVAEGLWTESSGVFLLVIPVFKAPLANFAVNGNA